MLNGSQLDQAIQLCQSFPVGHRGNCYRWIHLQWLQNFKTFQPLFANSGALASRYSPKNGPPALYMAYDAPTAEREFNQDYYQSLALPFGTMAQSLGVLSPEPGVIVGLHVRVSRLLDVNSLQVQQTLNTNLSELLAPWKTSKTPTATQMLGEAVVRGNWFEGIIYPSAQHADHRCVVVYPQRLLPNSSIHCRAVKDSTGAVIIPDHKLP